MLNSGGRHAGRAGEGNLPRCCGGGGEGKDEGICVTEGRFVGVLCGF